MKRPVATIAIVTLLGVAYVVELIGTVLYYTRDTGAGIGEAVLLSTFQGSIDAYIRLGAVTPDLFARGEWWRLITATLLHAGVLHLLFNAWALLQFGALFEGLFGGARLTLVYIVSGVIASAASASLLDVECSLGASGAVFGVVGALIAMIGTGREHWGATVRAQIAVWAAATLIAGAVSPSIDNAAHVAGFVSGLFLGTAARVRRLVAGRAAQRR
jgi:rhomboid protease GluP